MMVLLVIILVLFGAFTPDVIRAFSSSSTEMRVLISVIILFPMGLLLGMVFPIGMKMAAELKPEITPWLWGINGVMSVMATVISVIVSLKYGISASYWSGAACYLAAFLVFLFISNRIKQSLK